MYLGNVLIDNHQDKSGDNINCNIKHLVCFHTNMPVHSFLKFCLKFNTTTIAHELIRII